MNTQNRVFKKLAQAEKTELATQKVELANLNQLKAGIKKVEKDLKAGQKYENQYKKLTGEASDLARKFLSLSSDGKMGIPLSVNLFTMIKDIKAAGKELGVDMSGNSDVKFAQTVMNAWADWKDDVQKMSDKAAAMAKKLN
tara:strand:+ start:125 stop:547 length:423 start_codon:yes stop_codon:yes gene_type:complete